MSRDSLDPLVSAQQSPLLSAFGVGTDVVLQSILSSGIGCWDWDAATGSIEWTRALEELFGLPPGGAPASFEDYMALIHPEDRQELGDMIQRTVAGQVPKYIVEHRVIKPDGKVIWLEGRGAVKRDADGEALGMAGVAIDITDRKLSSEGVLTVSEGLSALSGQEFFQALVQHLTAVLKIDYALIAEIDPDNADRLHILARYGPDGLQTGWRYQLAGTPCHECLLNSAPCVYETGIQDLFPEDQDLVDMAASSYVGIPLMGKEGRQLGVLSVIGKTPLLDSISCSYMLRIFASRCAGELELRRLDIDLEHTEERYRSLIETAPDAILIFDPDSQMLVDANPQALKLFRISEEELSKKNINDLSPVYQPDGRASTIALADHIGRCRRGSSQTFEWTYLDTTGRSAVTEVRLLAIDHRDKKMIRASVLDISERKKAMEGLRASEQYLRIMLDSIGEAVIATDEIGRVKRMNPVAEELLGMESGTGIGRSLHEIYQARNFITGELLPNRVQEILMNKGSIAPNHDIVLTRNAGGQIRVSDSASPIRNERGQIVGVVLVFRDMTRTFEREEQLRHTQKMETIGQLAGGIAHDFNNMLAGIMGTADLLRMKLAHDEKLVKVVSGITKASDRAADLTKKLLAFSRKAQIQDVALDLHEIVQHGASLLTHSIDKRIRVDLSLDAEDAFVQGDPAQLENALLNLGLNARDAIGSGDDGLISIVTENIEVDADRCNRSTFSIKPGHYLGISVRDNGIGMSREVLQRVFEPFFTTKAVGQGTGLGLPAVYGTVTDHMGAIEVSSVLGVGTTFRILLPQQSQPGLITGSFRVPVEDRPPETGRGCVLVVDDEELVRDMAVETLQNLGYEVLKAVDGQDALAVYEAHSDKIDVVLLDMVMPRLSGRDAYLALREKDQSVRVILSSGYNRDLAIQDLLDIGKTTFLQKPYRTNVLAKTVKDMITRKKSTV